MTQKFKIGGKQRSVSFGLLAIEYYCEKMGGDIEQLDKIFTTSDLEQTKAICTLVWAGMIAAVELDGEELDFSLAKVKQWVGDMEQSDFEHLFEAFKKSKYLGKTIADYYYTPVEQEAAEKGKRSKTKKPLK